MKQLFLILILVALGVWAYLRYFRPGDAQPAPAEAEHHLARQGTFFVLQYVSIPAPHGVIGFEPGREVHFVRADRAKGELVVTDGEYEVEMKPSQLTNDLDIAALARKGDEDSQHRISAFLDHERALYEAMMRAKNIQYAQAMERAAKHLPPESASPSPTEPPNNPYSYLSAPQ
jgi:hypothetical protein